MLWFSNTIITILLTLLPDYCLCDRHEPKHITHIISVNLQQAWNYYWEVETEDTETQWIKWPKSRWGSSRIGVDHPKAQPLYHLHCSAALPQTTVFLVFCTLQIHSPSVSSGIFLLSGKPSKSPTLIAQTVLNTLECSYGILGFPTLWLLPHSAMTKLQLPGELWKVLMPRPYPRTIKSESPSITIFLKLPKLFHCAAKVENHSVPLFKYLSSPPDWQLLEGTKCLLITLVQIPGTINVWLKRFPPTLDMWFPAPSNCFSSSHSYHIHTAYP